MNRADTLNSQVRSADEVASGIVTFHREGLSRRRDMDLTAEKYAIHLQGDGQWAELYRGQKVVTPLGEMA